MSNPYTRGSSTSPYRVTFHRFVPESPTNRTLFDVLLASELLYFRAEGTIGRVTAPQSISSRSLAEKQFHQQLIHNFAKDHHESLITSHRRFSSTKNLVGGATIVTKLADIFFRRVCGQTRV